jgi:myo-inositol-1(or 4)-monophosphatase
LADFSAMLAAASEAARAAATVHEQYLGRVRVEDWSEKGIADFVTHVDREAEERIVDVITSRFPDHDILAEEAASDGARHDRKSSYLWVADPLDGTTNFLHQYPMYCASVGVLRDGVPIVAAVRASTGDEWTATRNGGAFLNGARIRVSAGAPIRRALIGTGFPFKKPEVLDEYLTQFRRVLSNVSDVRRGGSAALDLCHVASGYLDGFWELDLRPWDYAAGVLLIREAGGTVTGMKGEEPDYAVGGGILAGNSEIYSELKGMLNGGTFNGGTLTAAL